MVAIMIEVPFVELAESAVPICGSLIGTVINNEADDPRTKL